MNRIPIAFAFDSNLIMPACICISSLMMNARPDTFYDIFILYPETDRMDWSGLSRIPCSFPNCNIQYRPVGAEFNQAFETRGVTTPTYYRLLIPELVPEYDKIIYSDVDVIFRDDLSGIYMETNLEGAYCAGVNSLSSLIPDYCDYYARKLHLDPAKVIYAGNLIINSKQLLHDNVLSTFRTLAHNDYTFQDMDIINIACKGRIKQLPPSFCLTNYINDAAINRTRDLKALWEEKEIAKALTSGTVHYNGQKPWKGYCVNFDIWWEYYRKSPVFDERFYFQFFNGKQNELDHLSLWKRVKVLARWFYARG